MIDLLDIVGQDPAVSRLLRDISGGRAPHAYIFAGPEGVGRRTTASALAKTLLCENPAEQANNGRFADLPDDYILKVPCNQCEDCRMIDAGSHGDFHPVHKELAQFHDDPAVRSRTMQALGIDVIKNFLIAPAAMTPSRGKGKVFVVNEAELMTPPARNCLLKTLEEPPPGVTIILLAARADQLSATLLSRCAKVQFNLLPADFVANAIIERGMDSQQAKFWAKFTGGSLGRSIKLSQGDMYQIKCRIIDSIASLPTHGDAELGEELAKIADTLAADTVKQAAKDDGSKLSKALASRQSTSMMLEIISSAFRDAMTLTLNVPAAAAAGPIHDDQIPAIEAVAQRFEPPQLCKIIEKLSRYEQLLWRNVNIRILWDNVVITCGG